MRWLHGWLPCAFPAADSGAVRALASRLLADLASSLTALLGRWWPARLTDERAGAQPVARARPRYFVLFKPYMVLCSWEPDCSKNGRAPRTTLADLGLPSGVHNVGRLDRDTTGALLLGTDSGLQALLPALLHGAERWHTHRRRAALYHRVARLALARHRTCALAGVLHDLGWPPFRTALLEHRIRVAASLRSSAAQSPEGETARRNLIPAGTERFAVASDRPRRTLARASLASSRAAARAREARCVRLRRAARTRRTPTCSRAASRAAACARDASRGRCPPARRYFSPTGIFPNLHAGAGDRDLARPRQSCRR